jgi:hypothetical protein
MIDLKVKFDDRQLMASLDSLVANQTKAVVRALNKTAEQARTAASQEVRAAGYNIKASAIKRSFSIKRATANTLVVTLRATGAPIAVINYSARQTSSGVSVNVKTGRKILRHAFIATMKNGHRAVFERSGGKGSKRLPIKELFGPSIPTALGNDVVEKAIMKKIREKFPQILAHELAFLEMGK